jgi:hypothetical protein
LRTAEAVVDDGKPGSRWPGFQRLMLELPQTRCSPSEVDWSGLRPPARRFPFPTWTIVVAGWELQCGSQCQRQGKQRQGKAQTMWCSPERKIGALVARRVAHGVKRRAGVNCRGAAPDHPWFNDKDMETTGTGRAGGDQNAGTVPSWHTCFATLTQFRAAEGVPGEKGTCRWNAGPTMR